MTRSFQQFFRDATGCSCFPFQERFARDLPTLVNVPTGLGKTAMVVVGWLWRRFAEAQAMREKTPRRLVYCLPMRVLVEQTQENADRWLKRLRDAGLIDCEVPIHVLMGGESEEDWDIYPERDAIIIGTQDMLLSRALNRGYAATRSRWPMHFGMLHTDCLWVFDEIQLMGSGLATTAQLEAFRRLLPREDDETARNAHASRSVWMSATLDEKWLGTVDCKGVLSQLPEDARLRFDFKKEITSPEIDPEARKAIEDRWRAKKPLSKAVNAIDPKSPKSLAKKIVEEHGESKGRTIVVVNTVRRSCELLAEIRKQWPTATDESLILIHSRFRPHDRKAQIEKLKADTPPEQLPTDGMIVVSTQVIEAGVDVSATTLFTELAPWASLVQRFGRCNRRGEENDRASVRWIDIPDKDAAPYDAEDLKKARETLIAIGEEPEAQRSVNPAELSELDVNLPFNHTHVIRRRDLIDLFDTTPDLAGNNIDIDRFVREVEDSDVRVFWRAWNRPKGHEAPPADEPAPRREELCPAPIGEFRVFANKRGGQVWRWSFLDETWERANSATVAPGQVFLVHADAGGYSAETGWTPAIKTHVDPAPLPSGEIGKTPDATGSDRLCCTPVWQTLADHTDEVCNLLNAIVAELALDGSDLDVLRKAVRWHDRGKAHEVFVGALPEDVPDAAKIWAKGRGAWKRYGRPYFRHELASALAVLLESDGSTAPDTRNLIAYLVAAHHGKVRLSIRSLPNEMRPCGKDEKYLDGCRFARGVWDGDTLPATDLGGGITAPAVTLSLEPMELGLCQQAPFDGEPSWAERMIRLRDTLGPFRLAYLEAILRAADIRASKTAEQRAATDQPVGSGTDAKEADHG